MPACREVLEVFQNGGIHPKATDDLRAASALDVACHRDRSRSGVGREMLKLAGSPVRTISCAGNKDKTARRNPQHQVSTRSDVEMRVVSIADVYRRVDGLRRQRAPAVS